MALTCGIIFNINQQELFWQDFGISNFRYEFKLFSSVLDTEMSMQYPVEIPIQYRFSIDLLTGSTVLSHKLNCHFPFLFISFSLFLSLFLRFPPRLSSKLAPHPRKDIALPEPLIIASLSSANHAYLLSNYSITYLWFFSSSTEPVSFVILSYDWFSSLSFFLDCGFFFFFCS